MRGQRGRRGRRGRRWPARRAGHLSGQKNVVGQRDRRRPALASALALAPTLALVPAPATTQECIVQCRRAGPPHPPWRAAALLHRGPAQANRAAAEGVPGPPATGRLPSPSSRTDLARPAPASHSTRTVVATPAAPKGAVGCGNWDLALHHSSPNAGTPCRYAHPAPPRRRWGALQGSRHPFSTSPRTRRSIAPLTQSTSVLAFPRPARVHTKSRAGY